MNIHADLLALANDLHGEIGGTIARWAVAQEMGAAQVDLATTIIHLVDARLRVLAAKYEGGTSRDLGCWFIEIRRAGPTPYAWWNGESSHVQSLCWTVDPLKSVRFARREDAETVILGRDIEAGAWKGLEPFATEHEFI